MNRRPQLSMFGWLVVAWAAMVATFWVLALNRNFPYTARIILGSIVVLALYELIGHIRLAVNSLPREKESAEADQSGGRSEHTRGSGTVPNVREGRS